MNAVESQVELLGMSLPQLEAFFDSIGEKRFRATQVLKWIHQHGVSDFSDMTNVSKSLRQRLKETATIKDPMVRHHHRSADGTHKWVIALDQGGSVETVLIPDGDRATLCVSSQIGCSLDCSFCSTGKQGFNRNLTAAEIIGQLRVAIKSFGPFDPKSDRRVSNVVFMGMGEPLMNFDALVSALSLMMDDNAYGLSKRRVTVSTAGLVPGIDRLREVSDVSLALSLHAANDELRNTLVPLNKKYPIREVVAACNRYLDSLKDSRVITVEYTLIAGINDSPQQARELGQLLKQLPCKLNLIPFNPFPGSHYRRSDPDSIRRFQEILQKSRIVTTVRTTRGDDIDAACGQLVGQVEDRTRRSQKYISLIAEDAVVKPSIQSLSR